MFNPQTDQIEVRRNDIQLQTENGLGRSVIRRLGAVRVVRAAPFNWFPYVKIPDGMLQFP